MSVIYSPKGKAGEYAELALNIFTRCSNECTYCVDESTWVLMADLSQRKIKDVKVGDEIIGITQENIEGYTKYEKTKVLAVWRTEKEAYRIILNDGTELICSSEHRWLTNRGWKYTAEHDGPRLTTNNTLRGLGTVSINHAPTESELYMRGYISGILRGDASIGEYHYYNKPIVKRGIQTIRKHCVTRLVALPMKDSVALERTQEYLSNFGVDMIWAQYKCNGQVLPMIRTNKKDNYEKIKKLLKFEYNNEYMRGFLAGIYDAEGSTGGAKRIANTDKEIIEFVEKALNVYGFDYVTEHVKRDSCKDIYSVRIRGGIPEWLRFSQVMNPAIKRKFELCGYTVRGNPSIDLGIKSIEPLNKTLKMVDITTENGTFLANGVISHNCFNPAILRISREEFSKNVTPRDDLLHKLELDLKRGYIKTRNGVDVPLNSAPIHMCFIGDPYPFGVNSQITRDCISLIKSYGYNVQILTKGGLSSVRDFDLLGKNDWYGFSFTGYNTKEWEPYADSPENRIKAAELALQRGIKTWVSCEPVLIPNEVEAFLKEYGNKYDLVKIGKPNYMEIPNAPEWVSWGKKMIEICNEYGVTAALKDSLKGDE